MNILSRCAVGLLAWWVATECPAQTDSRRTECLAQMLRIFPSSPPWEKWLRDSGEQPPDFDALPSVAYLPDPLRFADGRGVTIPGQWPARREELLQLFQRYALGSVPPPPGNVRVAEDKVRLDGAVTIHNIILEFGPNFQAHLYLELYVPPGPGPFPVFLTQGTHRGWALMAVSRGYIGCAYAGGENRDDSLTYGALWPQFDWSRLTQRAWAASRAVDYLQSLQAVDPRRIAFAGHGANAKTALIAAALDERFAATILSSSGAGGACPFRLFSEAQFGEGIEPLTREHPDWFHPRLRFFVGRENRLPIDQNELLACVAPRPCLLASALNDASEGLWAVEHSQQSAERVYALLDAPRNSTLLYRQGGHEARAEDVQNYLDWLDTRFARRALEVGNRRLFPTYADWLRLGEEQIDPRQYPEQSLQGLLVSRGGNPMTTADEWKARRSEILARVSWGLGIAPPRANGGSDSFGAESAATASLMHRDKIPMGVSKRSITFGDYIPGDLYFPSGADLAGTKLPAVIWLHPLSTAAGYSQVFSRGEPFPISVAKTGFAVLAFDQIGNGRRIEEAGRFYLRYPRWSLMGRMVQEVRAAVDALEGALFIDSTRVFVAGYGTGGMTALYASALDDRIAGTISVGGFTPMRLDSVAKGTGGLARWSHWLPLLPRLGAFAGQESRLPYDFHEILAAIAPRPALIVAPQLDYQATAADVVACMNEARGVYSFLKAESRLALYVANDYHRFSPETQGQVIDQLKTMLQMVEAAK